MAGGQEQQLSRTTLPFCRRAAGALAPQQTFHMLQCISCMAAVLRGRRVGD